MEPLASLLLVSLWAQAAEPPAAAPFRVARAAGAISVDGDLSDPGWAGAAVMDRFYETSPGDNTEPQVRTEALLAYDERYLYIALRCFDPDPRKIRAPFVERDNVIGTDDNVAIFLDTRNDRRSAVEMRVSPRGIQADGVFTDATFNEDFSPDFLYDTAARITEEGWQAEVRVPFSSLRYPKRDVQEWGIRIWRNYPREFRYAFYSSPQPRGSNCYVCRLQPLHGLSGLSSARGLLLVPYAAGQSVAEAATPGDPLGESDATGDVGLDVKWTPSASTAVDATINPDFSQVEGDVAQIAVNERFALFFPEKRPFFLEGVDLLQGPIQAVYTRTITAPRGGLRVTSKQGATSYTALATLDQGGGLVVLPGPVSSDLAPQDFESWVGIGRLRRDLGTSFVGLLATGRAIDGGGHNVVFGPDFQWRGASDTITGQFLYSHSVTPDRPELAAEWDGRTLAAGAGQLEWSHDTRTLGGFARYRDFGSEFRDDQGFVPQVGYRQGTVGLGYNFWPTGFLRQVRPLAQLDYSVERDGDLLDRRLVAGVFLIGRKNLTSELDFVAQRSLTGKELLTRRQLTYFVQVDPSRHVPRVSVQGFVGEDIDIDNVRVGNGATINLAATIRPDPRLGLDLNSAVRWLDVDTPEGGSGRLFTAQVQRLKATVFFGSRAFLRLIGQYVKTKRDPALYTFEVAPKSGDFSGSALFSYRLNWQTALFLGYGDERALDEGETLRRTSRQFFAKVSYALQR
jgi:hypothetical protein